MRNLNIKINKVSWKQHLKEAKEALNPECVLWEFWIIDEFSGREIHRWKVKTKHIINIAMVISVLMILNN